MTEHEKIRRYLWMAVASAVARVEGSNNPYDPGRWANIVLDEFDKRFPALEDKKEEDT